MHELSVVMSMVEIAEQYARRAGARVVEEIELDIGLLSGIELAALDFAWPQAVRHSVLEKARRKINYIAARARCADCDMEFDLRQYGEACPACGSFLLQLLSGRELRVRSLLVSDHIKNE